MIQELLISDGIYLASVIFNTNAEPKKTCWRLEERFA